jgi:hypothetical protein
VFSGKLRNQNCNLEAATPDLEEVQTKWFYVKQRTSSAFSDKERLPHSKANPYKKLFRKGADIIPRGFYFVDLNQGIPPDYEERVINIKSASESQLKAQKPWTDIALKGRIESRFLFRTALARSIFHFVLLHPSLLVLPIPIDQNAHGRKVITIYSVDELMSEGFLNAARWVSRSGGDLAANAGRTGTKTHRQFSI